MARLLLQLTYECNSAVPQNFWLTRSQLKTLLDMLEKDKPSTRKIDNYYFCYDGYYLGFNSSKENAGKYGFKECPVEIKQKVKGLLLT
ncbi:hypothetical protein NAU58_21035 [Pseudomonas stutzeri]|uniref:hypothetical protein n=1 Tax=Stutzerimonas stutzeri TaxID=316 RepID=UPI00210CBA6D|nr:hypothetical protein [Stutzerimonas stutzeri]MCQ4298067.1 hypothetical protein [Stutzerimonas stutzeri]